MKIRSMGLFFLAAVMAVQVGCGGGGGGGTTPAPTSGVLTLTAGNLPTGTLIETIDVTISLPAGVTVKTVPDSVDPSKLVAAADVVKIVGNAATAGATTLGVAPLTPATATTPAKLRIPVLSPTSGFGGGDFVTIACDFAAGTAFPTPASFPIDLTSVNSAGTPSVSLVGTVTITATSFK